MKIGLSVVLSVAVGLLTAANVVAEDGPQFVPVSLGDNAAVQTPQQAGDTKASEAAPADDEDQPTSRWAKSWSCSWTRR